MSDDKTARLISLDEVYRRIGHTEPMTALRISSEKKVRFKLDSDWALSLETSEPDELVAATIDIDGIVLQLTKEAALQAGAAFGLPGAYVRKTPAHLIEPQLNYWYGPGLGEMQFNLMAVPDRDAAYAFAKPTVQPFSNIALLQAVESAVGKIYGGRLLADFKFDHSLTETNIRLVFEDDSFEVGDEVWRPGLSIKNSLIGKRQTMIDGYLLNQHSLAGAIVPLGSASAWSRKSQGQLEDLVLEWAQETVDEILPNLPEAGGQLARLQRFGIGHNLGDILREVFEQYKVPITQRNEVIEELLPIEDPSMYDLQQAISRSANNRALAPARIDTLLRISGAITAGVVDPEKARIWREGNKAPKGSRSPYEVEEKS